MSRWLGQALDHGSDLFLGHIPDAGLGLDDIQGLLDVFFHDSCPYFRPHCLKAFGSNPFPLLFAYTKIDNYVIVWLMRRMPTQEKTQSGLLSNL